MEVAETSNPSFRRVLVFCFLLVPLVRCFRTVKDSRFKIECQEVYVRNKLSSLSCEADKSFFDEMCDKKGQDLQFLYERADLDEFDGPYYFCKLGGLLNSSQCQSEAAVGNVLCEQIGEKWIYTCYFMATDKYLNVTAWCDINCESTNKAKLKHILIETTKCQPFVIVNETLTTAPPPPAKPLPPKEEFPLWAAILIALGIAGLIALVAFLVWRKRRQAQGPVQDTEGEVAEREGEGEGEGEDEGEGEEAEGASAEESQQPEEASEGGGEAPAEE